MRAAIYSALAAYWAGCFVYARNLPERYPIHFNLRGEPDGWATGIGMWYLLPIIGTATVLLVLGVSRLADEVPHLWNIPEKKRFLALTPEQRQPIVEQLHGILDVAVLYVVILLATCQWMIYQSAVSGQLRIDLLFHIVLWGGMVVLIWYAMRLTNRLKKVILAASDASVGRTS